MAVAMDNAILENILRQVRPLIGQGKVADYIPALATVDGSRLGIAICTVDGQLFQAGDAQERFSIQSISKVLSLVVAMRHYSEEEIWQRVGKDPSGSPFNSLVQLEMEQGIPRNPFINAGALVVCDMLQGRLSAPRQRMLEVVRGLSGVSDISYDTVVARSEFEHSARKTAMAISCGTIATIPPPTPDFAGSPTRQANSPAFWYIPLVAISALICRACIGVTTGSSI